MNPASRRNASISAAILATAIAGCNRLETTTDARLAPEPSSVLHFTATTQPVATDVASTQPTVVMTDGGPARAWPRSTATYQSGDTFSDSTGVRYISDVGQLFGRGGRTTRSDVATVGGGSYTTPIGTGTANDTGALASAGGTGGTGGGATGGVGRAGDETVLSNVQTPGRSTNAQTPAVASGSTVNGQVVRGDGSLAPVGSPGAAGTTGSIAAPAGGVGQSVAAEDVSAVDANAVDAGRTDTANLGGANAAGTPGAGLSTGQTIAAGAALPFVETGVFLANIVTSPVTFYEQRHGIVSGGFEFPPTYTAMPALPAEPGRVAPGSKPLPPVGVARPKQPLLPTAGATPATNPAAAAVVANPANLLPPAVPNSPLKPAATRPATIPTPPTTMPVVAPAPHPMIASAGRKPGTLARAPETSSNAFVVAGAAPYAGRFVAEPNLTLVDALRGAGVLPTDAASVSVRLQRRGSGVSAPVSLASLRARTGPDALVQPGDILTVVKSR